ncbi:MAG: ABC transporter substrate-binding protein [Deltaproteobacteria bacterium]|nr:ABC transporter substrate-binding protein [Deltaproteobacteria bacterium]
MEPHHLDPRFATDAYSQRIGELLYSSLVRVDGAGQIVPDLAERWEGVGAREFTFVLRQNVSFHNDAPFSADDVQYTFKTLLDEKYNSPLRAAFQDISEIDSISQYTIKFTLRQPNAAFLTSLAAARIVPKCRTCEAGEDWVKSGEPAPGTGPYLLKMRDSQEIRLEGFPNYFGGAPRQKEIIFRIVRDDNTRFLKFKVGEVDFLQNALPAHYVLQLKEENRYRFQTVPGTNYEYLGFNMSNPLLKDRRLRQAIAYGIDRDAIMQHVYKGMATLSTGLLPPNNPYYNAQVVRYLHNPERARKLLDEAGFKDPDGKGPKPRLTLSLLTSTNNDTVQIARIIRHQLQQIGIEVTQESREWGTFFSDIQQGKFQLFVMRWVGITDPDLYHDIFHSAQLPPGRNRGRYANPDIDRLVEMGRQEGDPKKRKPIYDRIQAIVSEDLPYVSLWHVQNVVLSQPHIENFEPASTGSFFALASVSTRRQK